MTPTSEKALLFVIVAAGLILRASGLHYGLPSKSGRLSTYNPDESSTFNVIAKWGSNNFSTDDLDVPPLVEKIKDSPKSMDGISMRLLEQLSGNIPDVTYHSVNKLVIVNAMNALLEDRALYALWDPAKDRNIDSVKSLYEEARASQGQSLSRSDLRRLNHAILLAHYPSETKTTSRWKSHRFLYFHPDAFTFWGGFHTIPVAATLKLAQMTGYLRRAPREFYMEHLEEGDKLYLLGRGLMLAASVLSIFVIFWVAKSAYDASVGLGAAAFAALAPVNILYAITLKADALMVFFALLSLYFAVRNLSDSGYKSIVLSGIFLGLASATKFNAGPYAIVLVLSCLLSGQSSAIKRIFIAGLTSFLMFCAASPYYVIEFPDLILQAMRFAGIAYDPPIFDLTVGPGWRSYVTHYSPYAIGWPSTLAGVAAFFYLLCRTVHGFSAGRGFADPAWKSDALFALGGLGVYLANASTRQGGTHYLLTVFPFFFIITARALSIGLRSIRAPFRAAFAAGSILLLGYNAAYAVAVARVYSGVNVREAASSWLAANVERGSAIGAIQNACQMPNIVRSYSVPYRFLESTDDYQLRHSTPSSLGLDGPILNMESVLKEADYIILTEHEYRNYLHPNLSPMFPEQVAMLREIMSLPEAARFESKPQLLGHVFPWSFPPSDWHIVNGTIHIYKNSKKISSTGSRS